MKNIRNVLVMLLALYSLPACADQVNIGIDTPDINIGIDLSDYPELVVVPGYPVYYAPQLDANYFFYDGEYWVYEDDNWYESSWYNGPWWLVDPEDVPEFILRLPVHYYLRPPTFFFIWQSDEMPHWGEHWGHDWEQHRRGWDKWNRNVRVKPAPLPVYQRQYSGEQYPERIEQQRELQQRHYRYQPRDPRVQQHYQKHPIQGGPIQQQIIIRPPQEGGATQQDNRRSAPHQQGGSGSVPGAPAVQQEHRNTQRSIREGQPTHLPVQEQKQQPKHEEVRHEQQVQRPQNGEARPQGNETRQQDRGEERESGGGRGRDQERGRDR